METIPPHYFTHSEMAHSHYSQLRFSGLSSASSAASWYEAQRASPSTCSTGNAHSRSHVSGIGVSQYNECTPSTRPRRLSSPRVSRRSSSGKDGIPTNSIPHLREALSSLDSQMATLMSEKRKLESHLEQAVRLQSPVLRLPRELLGSIFITGVLLDEDDRLLVSTLMLVCKEWAEVALNTPQLWSRITICDKHSMMKACKKLDRSKSVPLDIGVRFNPQLGQDEATTELVIRTIDILRPSIRRWRTFRLAVPYRIHAYIALKELNEQAPLLEDFAVQVHHLIQDDKRSQLSFPLFGGYTPRLRSTAFTSFNFDWDMHLVSRLRVLKLGGFYNSFAPSVPTLLNILRACPDLEELAFRNMSDVENAIACPEYSRTDETEHASMLNKALYPKASDMIELPRLKKASFYYAGIERIQSIFSQLAFPALEELEFCYMDNVTPVLRHLKRQTFTSFPLKHLRIESCYFNELKLVKLLGRLKSLQVLELVEVDDISSNFLGGLSRPQSAHDWVCPNLETLCLDGCSVLHWDSIRSFVESRLPTNSSRLINPTNPSEFPRNMPMLMSSASSYAARQKVFTPGQRTSSASAATTANKSASMSAALLPKRLKCIDVTRCPQITKEMLQWLRMYVSEVQCQSTKTYWGDFGFS